MRCLQPARGPLRTIPADKRYFVPKLVGYDGFVRALEDLALVRERAAINRVGEQVGNDHFVPHI